MPITGSQKALMYARSGLARSGATRSDYYQQGLVATIGGVSYGNKFWKGSTRVSKTQSAAPNRAVFTTFDIDPPLWSEVIIANGSIDNRLFGGILVDRQQLSVKSVGGTPVQTLWACTCLDWSFDLAGTRVLASYPEQPAHLIALELAGYAPGYSTAKIKTGAPVIEGGIAFDLDTTVPAAFAQLAARTPGWKFRVDEYKVFHFYDVEETVAQPAAITPANLRYDQLAYGESGAQTRTQVIVEGGGGKATAPVASGATSLPVDECGWYEGTAVKVGHNQVTYGGRSATSGPGFLTGIPASGPGSIVHAIPQGADVWILVTVDDLAAQAALQAAMGGPPHTGIRTYFLRDHTLSVATATARGQAELALFPVTAQSGGYETYDKVVDCGLLATIALSGRGLTVSAGISSVDIWFENPTTTKRKATFDSAVRIDLPDIVRSLGNTPT